MTPPSKIRQLWELFIQSESSSYEKSSWLNIFLAEFLAQVHEGKSVEEILSFCLAGGVATFIGCEFLTDVHQICSQPGDEGDLAPLCHYLLCGRGWQSLAVLHCLGVQNLTCGRELASLLMSLYPICLQNSSRSKTEKRNPYIVKKAAKNIEDIFKVRAPLKHKFRFPSYSHNLNLCPPSRAEFHRSHSTSSTSRPRRNKNVASADDGKGNEEGATSESEQLGEDIDPLPNKVGTLKIRLDPMDFDYFTSVVRSEDEARLDSHVYTALRNYHDIIKEEQKYPDDFKDERILKVLECGICNYEFSDLVIKLLNNLCSAEFSVTSDNGHQIAIQAINFSIENLCSLQFGSASTDTFTSEEIAELKSEMVRLLITALEKVLMYLDITMTVIRSGMLPVLLKVLEDAICKISAVNWTVVAEPISDEHSRTNNIQNTRSVSQKEANKIQEFIFGTIYGIITFLYGLLLQRCTLDKFRDFLELFHLFSECHNGRLVEKCIISINCFSFGGDQVSFLRTKKIIDLTGQLITTLKKIRSEIVHSYQCRRTRHKQCISNAMLETHHHHDLFGAIYSTCIVTANPLHTCCIASLFMMLVRLLNTTDIQIESRVIKVMMSCGTCCCFPVRSIISPLSNILKRNNSNCRQLIFNLLERVVYYELGAFVTNDSKVSCVICKNESSFRTGESDCSTEQFFDLNFKNQSCEERQSEVGEIEVSATEKISTVSSFDFHSAKNSWNCLELYRDILKTCDMKLCHDLTSHLLKVSPRCTYNVKQELLFNVFYPIFCSYKATYLYTEDAVSKFNVLSCLSIFSSLLGSINFTEQFITLGGLNHILDLISLPVFSKSCCSVLEVVAIVEIWNLESDLKLHRGTVDDSSDLKQILSLSMLQNAMEASSAKLLAILCEYGDKINEIIDVSNSSVQNVVMNQDKMNCNLQSDTSQLVLQLSVLQELHTDVNIENNQCELIQENNKIPSRAVFDCYCQLLPTVCVFWRSCANLVIYSPRFRHNLSSQPVAQEAGRLLLATLNRIVLGYFFTEIGKDDVLTRGSEVLLHLKLFEATLVVCLATPVSVNMRGTCTSSGSSESVVEDLWKILLRANLSCCGNVRHLCEVLLRCAVAECCQEHVMPPNKKPKLPSPFVTATWDESVSDAEEDIDTTQRSNDYSSVDDSYITADEGYEADIELIDNGTQPFTLASANIDDASSLDSPVGSGPGWSEYGRNHNITHPSLCILAIDFIVHLNKRYYEMLSNDQSSVNNARHEINGNDTLWDQLPSETLHLQNLAHCIQRLVTLCRDNPQNCIILAKNHIITKLLEGFENFMKTQNPDYTELQTSILELLTFLARYSITSEELSTYLNFFKFASPPMESLLTPLTTLVTASRPQPHYISCFPLEIDTPLSSGSDETIKPADSEVSSSPSSKNSSRKETSSVSSISQLSQSSSYSNTVRDNAGSLATSLHFDHSKAGIISAWSSCAVAIPIHTDLGWNMWLNGFSLSMWLRLERGNDVGAATLVSAPSYPNSLLSESASGSFSDWRLASDQWVKDNCSESAGGGKKVLSENVLHLFSIGYDSLLLEAWSDTLTDTITFKLTRSECNKNEVVSESSVENCLTAAQWHHLAINVSDIVQNKKVIIELKLLINGWREVKVTMSYGGLLVRKLYSTCFLLGQTFNPNTVKPIGSWYLGSTMLFRCPVFTKERAIYLVGLGPNCTNLTDCDVDRINPNFTSVFGPKTLCSGIDWDTVLQDRSAVLKDLQENILLTYSSQDPCVVNVYPQVVTNPGGMVGNLFPSQPGFRVVGVEYCASQQLPLAVKPILLTTPNSQQYKGLLAAANVLGGTPVFMFLFARVVEMRASQEAQAKALFLLLKLVQADSELFTQFVNQDCHKLLSRVLSSSRCIPGHHVLKAVLDTCCDKPVLQYHPGPRKFHIANQSDAIVVNSFLLSTIVASWREWERAGEDDMFQEGGGVLGTLFHSLHVLLRDDHPFREFNATQLNRVRMVEALLLFCKERFLYEESLQLHASVCSSLVELVRSLMGAPPEFSHIVAVTDFLVLLHQASATYVTHVRPSFYFLLSAQPPYSTSSTTDADTKSKLGKKEVRENKDKSSKDNFAQPVDPQKLNKALTNLQIKQYSEDLCADDLTNQVHRPSLSVSATLDSNKVDDFNNDSSAACNWKEAQNNNEKEMVPKSSEEELGSSVPASYFTEGNKLKNNNGLLITTSPTDNSEVDDKNKNKNVEKSQKELQGCEKFTIETAEAEVNSNIWHEDSVQSESVPEDNTLVVKEEKCLGSNGDKGMSQSLVVEGLLLLLRDTLLVLPDNMAYQVLNHVVKAEALLVMANHADSRVRTAVVKVLSAYLQSSTDEEINKFLKIKGFYQLANQLSLFPASVELVEACVALVTHCSVSLQEQAEISSLTDLSFLQANSFPPLLALLPRCVHDIALAHNLIVFLREVFTKSLKSQSLRTLLDCGLLESLEKTLIAVSHTPSEPSDLYGITEQDFLIGDLQVFLMAIVSQVLCTPGAHHMQVISEIQLQFSYLEKMERTNCGVQATCVNALRGSHCVILEGALDILQERICALQTLGSKSKNTASFLSSVLSHNYEEPLYPTTSDQPLKLDVGQTSSPSYTGGLLASNAKSTSGIQSKDVPRNELNERFKNIIIKSVDFLTNAELVSGSKPLLSPTEENFCRRLFSVLLRGVQTIVEKRNITQRSTWNQVIWTIRDVVRVQGSRLLVWMLSPVQPLNLRLFAVHSLHGEQRCKEIITALLHTNTQMEQKFLVFIRDLIHNGTPSLPTTDQKACIELHNHLDMWDVSTLGEQSTVCEEARLLVEDMERQQNLWVKQNESAMLRTIHKFESLMKTIAEAAMGITRLVVEIQNSERKVFMEHIKLVYSENVQIRIKWQKIVQQLTHERAVWFFPDSNPKSWQLDATEGRARVRNRLQRCHMDILKRYLMPEAQYKCETMYIGEPLAYLFDEDMQSSTSTVLIERLHTNEKIQHMCAARLLTTANEVPGELLIGETCLYFISDDSISGYDLAEVTAGRLDVTSTAWKFEYVKEIHNRRFQLQERALEIFLTNGKTYLMTFYSSKERDKFAWELSQCHFPNLVVGDNLSDVVQMWREGLITNWEYLIHLNKMAGRSFNDLMQYPVFPFVLSDYTSQTLDLRDPKVYRNFKRPMAVQDRRNEQHYINNYNYLKQEIQECQPLGTINQEPYHYGSHYSNSGTVLHFLVRLPPFTRMFLTYQDHNFDLPDRTFHSLHTTWRLASSDSTTDVKELIPEFFCLPEFLLNNEDFNFGVRQNGERVHHVNLPPWCKGNPRLFILMHKQALESDFVRENLPHWIDLVFGYKQTGKMAVDSINVFHPATYYGFDVGNLEDPLERMAWETMIRTYGQTPRQLFRTPHPMVIQSLSSHGPMQCTRNIISTVKGLVWGSYVGSPAEPDPIIIWRHQHRTPIGTLVPLRTNDVFGLAPQTCLLLNYSKEKGLSMINTTSVTGAALVSWGHSDCIIRTKLKKEHPPRPVVKSGGLDPICLCASVPDCNQLWLGHCSGKMVVFEYKFDPGRGVLEFCNETTTLLGHTAAITCIYICRSFFIVASGSQDNSIILWDLNSLSYVRSMHNVGAPINLLCISESTGDVAAVYHSKTGSTLNLYTVNASLVGCVHSAFTITALCFSSAPEGVSVNVVATGLSCGVIRLWSTWDLTLVREINCHFLNCAIISLTYSYDSQHLYASTIDGNVVIWESGGTKGVSRPPKFLNLTSL